MNKDEVTFQNMAAQGDLLIKRVDKVPSGFVEAKENTEGGVIVAHSETGHHHVILSGAGVAVLEKTGVEGTRYVRVETEAKLEHRRAFDKHKTIVLPSGLFELRRQQEYSPEGWRMVMD